MIEDWRQGAAINLIRCQKGTDIQSFTLGVISIQVQQWTLVRVHCSVQKQKRYKGNPSVSKNKSFLSLLDLLCNHWFCSKISATQYILWHNCIYWKKWYVWKINEIASHKPVGISFVLMRPNWLTWWQNLKVQSLTLMATAEADAPPRGVTSADPLICSFCLKLFWSLCQESK